MYLSLLQCGRHTVTFFQKVAAWNGGEKSNFTGKKADKKVPYPGGQGQHQQSCHADTMYP